MDKQTPYLSDADFAQLNFGDRFSLAKELTKGYGLKIFLVMLVIGLVLTAYAGFTINMLGVDAATLLRPGQGQISYASTMPFGLLLLFILAFAIIPFFGVGLKNVALHYILAAEPVRLTSTVLAPLNRLSFFLICFFLWFVAYIGFQIISLFLGVIPGIGAPLIFILSIFYYLINNCAISYMADRGAYQQNMVDPIKAVTEPFKIVCHNLPAWIGALAMMFLLFLIPGVLVGFGGRLMQSSGSDLGWILVAIGGLVMVPIAVFDIFFMTITYKHTSGRKLGVSEVFE